MDPYGIKYTPCSAFDISSTICKQAFQLSQLRHKGIDPPLEDFHHVLAVPETSVAVDSHQRMSIRIVVGWVREKWRRTNIPLTDERCGIHAIATLVKAYKSVEQGKTQGMREHKSPVDTVETCNECDGSASLFLIQSSDELSNKCHGLIEGHTLT